MSSELPEPSIKVLVTQLAMQALMELGQAPNPLPGASAVAPDRARFTVGLIEVLGRATRGNLTPEEDKLLGETLARLRAQLARVGGPPTATT